jgi:hypothetical protein
VILSDGDVVFQPRKVRRSGLWDAVEGRVLIYIHKELMLDDVERHYNECIQGQGASFCGECSMNECCGLVNQQSPYRAISPHVHCDPSTSRD